MQKRNARRNKSGRSRLLAYLRLCWHLVQSHALPHRAANAPWPRKVKKDVRVRRNSSKMHQKQKYCVRKKFHWIGTVGSCEPHSQRLAAHQQRVVVCTSRQLGSRIRSDSASSANLPINFFSYRLSSLQSLVTAQFRLFQIVPLSFPSQSLHPRSFYSLSRLGKKLRPRCNPFRTTPPS